VRFWETSAIVPLVLEEPNSAHALALLEQDDQMAVWWCTTVEAASACARLRRDGVITTAEEVDALRGLDQLRAHWFEISPTDEVRTQARRLLRTHRLRAGDALQLAAAAQWMARLDTFEFVSFDSVLREAAELEGLVVV
jgi:predicted nucleic acid-binding protein